MSQSLPPGTTPASDPGSKTVLRRREQYRDRWTSFGATTGLQSLSDKLSVAQLRGYEIFAEYDDAFLERISPDVSLAVWEPGAVLFEEGTYIDLAFAVVEGQVEVLVRSLAGEASRARPIFDPTRTVITQQPDFANLKSTKEVTLLASRASAIARRQSEITFLATMESPMPADATTRLGPGEVFGEIGALSGWPQSVTARTASECRLLQIRVPALRLMKKRSDGLRRRLDLLYRQRSLAVQLKGTPLFADCSEDFIEGLKEMVELVSCRPGEVIARHGDPAETLYLVRSGFLALAQPFGEGEMVVSYLSKGMTLGEVELLVDGVESWQVTATSVEHAELVALPKAAFGTVLRAYPGLEDLLWQSAVDRLKEAGFSRRHVGHSEFTQVALDQGLVQGSSMLVIDLTSCTRCDDCVRACADTHGGRPRFVREGDKYKQLLIARSCYHCQDPVCLIGCPTGAIHRAGLDDVVEIDEAICIGCSTCANNCPYDAIVMHDTGETWPDDMVPVALRERPRRLASKCDLCHDTGHGPACVSNCPQGCAYRVGSLEEFETLLEGTS